MALQRLDRLRLRLIVVARTSAPLGGRRTGAIRTHPPHGPLVAPGQGMFTAGIGPVGRGTKWG